MSGIYDGREVANAHKNQSTNCEMFSVGTLFNETISLPGLPGLCMLLKD